MLPGLRVHDGPLHTAVITRERNHHQNWNIAPARPPSETRTSPSIASRGSMAKRVMKKYGSITIERPGSGEYDAHQRLIEVS